METIKTGLYKKIVIRKKEEITISKGDLEKSIEEIGNLITLKESEKNNCFSHNLNLERLKRVEQTGQMLLKGYSLPEIASNFNMVDSTVESYIHTLIYQYPKT